MLSITSARRCGTAKAGFGRGMVRQHLAGPADQARRRLVAGSGDHTDVGEELLARESPRGAGLVLELGV